MVFAALTPFAYDDKRKETTDEGSGAKNEAEAEIQAAKAHCSYQLRNIILWIRHYVHHVWRPTVHKGL